MKNVSSILQKKNVIDFLANPIYWPGGVYGIPEEGHSYSQMFFLLPASSQLPTWKELTHFSRLNLHVCSSLKFSKTRLEANVLLFVLLQCCRDLVTWYSYCLFSYQFPSDCEQVPLQAGAVVCAPAPSTEPEYCVFGLQPIAQRPNITHIRVWFCLSSVEPHRGLNCF